MDSTLLKIEGAMVTLVPFTFLPEPTATATRYDTGKVRLDLVPVECVEAIAQVLTFGVEKYAAWNWAGGFKWSRIIGSLMRHLFAFLRGEKLDPETGLPHTWHLGANVFFLIWHEMYRPDLDDRFVLPTPATEEVP
jgi:Domain of unknown function (DUF5664)